ncbi:MAG: 16S rRNA (uracil(1498)-N(3))-methyltransferase [Simkaniaceae bacterium]|jgi:16S rRNA (uracil1498-N3)-methyltransferase|nr:MAG: 16S rRNA (uracil(1498)-N(3))-methyltransferase [Simkaniaceae bacterium]
MPHDRFYIDAPLVDTLSLEGEEFYHLSRVMRKREGVEIELVNGRNVLALARIESLQKNHAELSVLSVEEKEPHLPPLTLVQALPKLPNLELIIQKGTELGVSTFYLYHSALSEKKELTENQKRRLRLILIGAMKQCGRLDLPEIKWEFPKLKGNVYFGDLSEKALPLSTVGKLPATLIIGPEKGLTQEEINDLAKIGEGVSIGPYILRAETAALAGLSILASKKAF